MSGVITFDALTFVDRPGHPMGVQARTEYPNGYGASVIRGPQSYGGPEGFYELAVFRGDDLCYDTPVTDDVEGWLTPERVTELLQQIAALPPSGAAE